MFQSTNLVQRFRNTIPVRFHSRFRYLPKYRIPQNKKINKPMILPNNPNFDKTKHIFKTLPRYDSVLFNKVFKRQYSTNKSDTSELFVAISELDKYNIRLDNFPSLGVIGPQSSGKSSVLEAICSKDILPKHMGMVWQL